jgi:hypothetical protein
MRGGSWNNDARNVRAACRNDDDPEDRDNNLGFRCARALARMDVRARTGRCSWRSWLVAGVGRNATKAGVVVGTLDDFPNPRRPRGIGLRAIPLARDVESAYHPRMNRPPGL